MGGAATDADATATVEVSARDVPQRLDRGEPNPVAVECVHPTMVDRILPWGAAVLLLSSLSMGGCSAWGPCPEYASRPRPSHHPVALPGPGRWSQCVEATRPFRYAARRDMNSAEHA